MPVVVNAAQHSFIVRATYRDLFRAMLVAFEGDVPTFCAARSKARESFREDADRINEIGTQVMAQRIEHAQGVTKILREHVVQGRSQDGQKFRLMFTKDTQRLDNDDAKKLKGTTKSFKQIKNERF